LAFNGVALAALFVALRIPWFQSASSTTATATDQPAAAAVYLGPLLAILAAMMLGHAFAAGWDWLYSLRLLACAVVVWLFRREYLRMNWRTSWQAALLGVLAFAIWLPLELATRGVEAGAPLAQGLAEAPTGLAVL
jgi:hypothetical protein